MSQTCSGRRDLRDSGHRSTISSCSDSCWIGLLTALAGILLAACASVADRPMTPVDGVRAVGLQKVDSEERLSVYLEANRVWFASAMAERNKAFCALPGNLVHWRCWQHGLKDGQLDRIEVTGSRISAADVITNNQEQGVDEGDIVKKLGDRLFVLRRGRLHVVELVVDGRPDLQLADTLVVATDIEDDQTTWYDELLAVDGMLILLGFNWDEEVAELSLFDLQADGRLTHRLRYWIRVEDYFSGSNYGARIEGDHLLISLSSDLDLDRWPSWSRRDEGPADWLPLIELANVHLPLAVVEEPALHIVLRCPLHEVASGQLRCLAMGVIGSSRSEFYASPNAAYLSIAEWDEQAQRDPRFNKWRVHWDNALRDLWALSYTLVYRVPFDKDVAPGVIRVDGTTGNQFSFMERDEALHLTTESQAVDGGRELTLWRAHRNAFDARGENRAEEIARFTVSDAHRTIRFTQDAVWVGAHGLSLRESNDPRSLPPLLRQPLSGASIQEIPITHAVDMIEPLPQAVLTSGLDTAGRWQLSLVTDADETRSVAERLQIDGLVPSESRSHAFNASQIYDRWVFGMPVVGAEIESPWKATSDLALFDLARGRLEAPTRVDMQQNVDCEDHCHDWYGNARVFFIDDRAFALSGGLIREVSMPLLGGPMVLRTVTLD